MDIIGKRKKIKIEILKKLYSFDKYPKYLILFVTNVCNAKCEFCFNDVLLSKKHLSLETTYNISKKLKKLVQLTLSGGEPVLNPDLFEIIEYFYINNDLNFLTITTNGYFSDKITLLVNKLIKNCPNLKINVSISIDDIGKKHDSIRKVNGLFNQIRKTHEELLVFKKHNNNITLTATTVLNKKNCRDIYKIVKFIYDNFLFDDNEIVAVRGKVKNKNLLEFNPEIYKNVSKYKNILYLKRNGFKHYHKFILNSILYKLNYNILKNKIESFRCPAGTKLIEVDQNGNIFPCELIYKYFNKYIFGNINEEKTFFEILNQQQNQKLLNFIHKKKCICTFECALYSGIVFYPIKNIIMNLWYLFK